MVSINMTDIQDDVIKLRPGITARVARSYIDMRATTEELLNEHPSEARLLMFVLLSNMIFTMSWALKMVVSPTATASAVAGSDMALWLVVALMMRTTAIYGLALGIGVIVKLLGGKATLAETRAGVIWGVFVTAPIGLAIALFVLFINEFEGTASVLQSAGIQMTPYWIGIVPFIWFVAKGAAAANRFDNIVPVFGVISAIAVGLAYAIRFMAIV